MMNGVGTLIAAADTMVPRITPERAKEIIDREQALVVDVRDAPELAGGTVEGAVHVSRGMLEFRADPASPYHDSRFDRERTVILYCASGGRSALGGKALMEMGYERVYNLGAFKDWVASGGPVETPIDRGM